MTILIVEDEPHAQYELKRLLNNISASFQILACIDSIEETVKWLKENPQPDVIMLDIQLSDGLSFEIFKKHDVRSPVIFTTAYDEYAIRAFKVNSVDYLLKPVKQEELTAALNKLDMIRLQYSGAETLPAFRQIEELIRSQRPEYKTRFIAKVGDQIKHIDINEVAYFKAEDNEVFLVSNDNRRVIIEHSLDQLERVLNPGDFFRITRGYIASAGSIGKISKYFNSRLLIELKPPADDKIMISRVRVQDFLKWMDR
ncbi:MAG: LytTR family DNA-binding domain-containing protein [Bacteroidetes bacterium]|nr:LytTR family DNA-binding domain-containing protein [Bacteroidota bacterium]